MSTVDLITDAVLAWLRAANGGLTNAQVIRAEAKGSRPPKPYLTVKASPGLRTPAHDEPIDAIDGGGILPDRRVRGQRIAAVTVQGFGSGAFDWLEAAGLSLQVDSIRATLTAAGLTIRQAGDPTDISTLIDTAFEPRWEVPFAADYAIETDPVTGIELALIEVAMTFQTRDGDPSAFTDTLTATL